MVVRLRQVNRLFDFSSWTLHCWSLWRVNSDSCEKGLLYCISKKVGSDFFAGDLPSSEEPLLGNFLTFLDVLRTETFG